MILPVVPIQLVPNCLSVQSPAFPKPQEPTAEPPKPPANLAAPPSKPYVENSPNIGNARRDPAVVVSCALLVSLYILDLVSGSFALFAVSIDLLRIASPDDSGCPAKISQNDFFLSCVFC